MDLSSLVMAAGSMLVIVSAVVQVAKKTFSIKKRYVPIASVICGVLTGIVLHPLFDSGWYYMIIVGFLSGLAASGAFDTAKYMQKKIDNNKDV